MAIDAEVRRILRCDLFASVGELADREFQRATWLDPEMQNPHYTFVEFVECFYDVAGGSYESADPVSVQAPFRHLVAEGVLSEQERDAVWPLHIALRNFPTFLDDDDHAAILNDPRWHEVCEAAVKARMNLIAVLDDPTEEACFATRLPGPDAKRWP